MKKRKFKVGDIIIAINNSSYKHVITGVNEEAQVYEVDNKPIEVECLAFKYEELWQYFGTYSPCDAKMETPLKERYYALANDYLSEFVKQTGIEDDAPFWVANAVGTVACVGDYFVDYKDIRLCVDNNIQFKDFDEWYDYSTDVAEIDDNLFVPTLEAWLNGAFQPIPQKRRDELKQLKQTFLDAIMEEINKSEKKEEDNVEEV